jgi:quercetin dioxygenase-like cupin family protein
MKKEMSMSTAPKSEILSLSSLADYQTGGIVSRQISLAENGNITLFAFDQDQELSEHTTPFDALVQVLDGEVEIKISGRSFLLKKDEAIIMPANQPHAVNALKRFKMLLTMIKS